MRASPTVERVSILWLPLYALLLRELLVTLRTWRMALLVGFVAAMCVIPVPASWPGPGVQLPNVYYGISESIVSLVATIVMGFGMLGMTLIAAASFTAERDDDTLDVLVMTGLTPSLLVGAKILALLVLFGLLLVALLPIVASVYFHVGVDVVRLFEASMLLFASAASAASIGVFSSIAFRNLYACVVIACTVTLVASGWILVPIMFAAVYNILPAGTFDLYETSRFIFPLSAATISLQPGAATNGFSVLCCCAFQFFLAAVLWRSGSRRLQRTWSGRGRAAHLAPHDRARHGRPLPPHRSIPDRANSIAYKELRYDLVHQRRALIVASAAGFLTLFVVWSLVRMAYAFSSNRASLMDAMIAFFALQQFLIPLMFIPFCVQLLAKEHCDRSLDAIRMTGLGSAAVFRGKLSSALVLGLAILVIAAVAALPVAIPDAWPENAFQRQLIVRQAGIAVMGVATIGVCGLLANGCGFLAGTLVRDRQAGIALGLAAYVTAIGGAFLAATLFRKEGHTFTPVDRALSEDFWVNGFSPIIAYVQSMDYINGAEFVWEFWLKSVLGFTLVGGAFIAGALVVFARRYKVLR